jgi:hypothetical protein
MVKSQNASAVNSPSGAVPVSRNSMNLAARSRYISVVSVIRRLRCSLAAVTR